MILTLKNGQVELKDERGNLIRKIGRGNAVNAVWSGEKIHITKKDGKNELREKNGNLIRMI